MMKNSCQARAESTFILGLITVLKHDKIKGKENHYRFILPFCAAFSAFAVKT